MDYLKAEGMTMEIEDLKETGVVDRHEMKQFIEKGKRMKKIQQLYGDKYFLVIETLFFGFSKLPGLPRVLDNFQMSAPRILSLQRSVEALIETEKEGALVLVLGIVNHWV